ncbi:MAG: hypothetical protein EA362_13415 [Saprospirales bacterium]|nr:MAG: hypothetical protein EA362_13415 [Saprospirales bacterium]
MKLLDFKANGNGNGKGFRSGPEYMTKNWKLLEALIHAKTQSHVKTQSNEKSRKECFVCLKLFKNQQHTFSCIKILTCSIDLAPTNSFF